MEYELILKNIYVYIVGTRGGGWRARSVIIQLQINNRYFSLVTESCHYRERSNEEESPSLSHLYVIRR